MTTTEEISSVDALTLFFEALAGNHTDGCADEELAASDEQFDVPAPLVIVFEGPKGPVDIAVDNGLLDDLWDALMRRNNERLAEAAMSVAEARDMVHRSEEIVQLLSDRYESEKLRAFPADQGFW